MARSHTPTDERHHVAPERGARIVTADHEALGLVKETADGYFKVDARWARDYWLSVELIQRQDAGAIVLCMPRDLLSGYKLRHTARGFEPMVRIGKDPEQPRGPTSSF